MKDFFLLTKTLIKHTFRFDKSQQRSKGMLAAYIIIAVFSLPLLALIAIGTYNLGLVVGAEAGTGLLATMITVCQFVVVLFGIPVILNTIYFSKDSEMLLALPFKPATIFSAKFFIAFLIEFTTSALMLLVVVVPFVIGAGAFNIWLLLSFFVVPLLPMLLAAIIAIPLMYIVSFFRSKGIFTSIVMLALFGFFFTAYYLLVMRLQTGGASYIFDNIEETVAAILPAFDNFAKVMFPNRFLAISILHSDFGTASLNFVYILGINAALFAVAVFISSLVYRRSISKQLENVKNQSGKKTEFATKGNITMLISKDVKEIMRYPSLAFLCLMQVIFAPIMIFVFGYSSGTFSAEEGAVFSWADLLGADKSLSAVILLGIFVFMILAMNYTSSTAISRENYNCYILKIIPVPYRQILDAKAILGFVVNEITITLSLVVAAIILQPPVVSVLLVFASVSILGCGFSYFQVLMDLSRPRLKWDNPSRGLKNSFGMLIGMALAFGIIVVLAVLYAVLVLLSPDVGPYVFWSLIFLVFAAATYLMRALLMKNADKGMTAIEI